MPNLPQLSDLSTLVFDRHPFGTLACIVLAGLAVGGILAVRVGNDVVVPTDFDDKDDHMKNVQEHRTSM